MKFSIIVPVYNVEKYIDKCISSIRNQSYPIFECIVVDDGSKDSSISIAKELIKDDERFIILSKQNGGLSDARNFGLNKASGDYVWFVDSDDFIEKNALELLKQHLDQQQSDIVCFDMIYLYPDNHTSISKGANFKITNFNENKHLINIDNSANSKIFKTSFLKGKKFPKGMWYEDLAVVTTWLIEATSVSYLEKALYYYLQREGSITQSADERVFDIYKAISMIKAKVHAKNIDIDDLIKQRYIDDCLIMTTLRIKNYSNRQKRLEYYALNLKKLEDNYPNWYMDAKNNSKYTFKQKMIFFLLKYKMFYLVDILYRGL